MKWTVIIADNAKENVTKETVVGTREQVVDYVKYKTFSLTKDFTPDKIILGNTDTNDVYSATIQYRRHHITVSAFKECEETAIILPERIFLKEVNDDERMEVIDTFKDRETLGEVLYEDFFEYEYEEDEEIDYDNCGKEIMRMSEDNFVELPSGFIIRYKRMLFS